MTRNPPSSTQDTGDCRSGTVAGSADAPSQLRVSASREPSTIAAFTPGPWEARGGLLHRLHWIIDAPGWRFIATIDGPRDEEGEANARLIAAAPELYEAVRLFVEEYDAGDEDDGVALMLAYNYALEAAKAALAKARGQ